MATDKRIVGAGFQITVASGTVVKKLQEAILEGLKEVGKNYKAAVIKNISLDDHTLEELRLMGHPYSVDKPADTIHGDDRLVHEQTGEFKRSIKVSEPEATSSRRFSIFARSDSPKMKWLIFGTSRMRPRRFHEKAYEDIKPKLWKPVEDLLRKLNYRMGTKITQPRR
jgi:hypothetical protein